MQNNTRFFFWMFLKCTLLVFSNVLMQGYEDRSWLNEMERGPLRLRPLVCWLASYMRRGNGCRKGVRKKLIKPLNFSSSPSLLFYHFWYCFHWRNLEDSFLLVPSSVVSEPLDQTTSCALKGTTVHKMNLTAMEEAMVALLKQQLQWQ